MNSLDIDTKQVQYDKQTDFELCQKIEASAWCDQNAIYEMRNRITNLNSKLRHTLSLQTDIPLESWIYCINYARKRMIDTPEKLRVKYDRTEEWLKHRENQKYCLQDFRVIKQSLESVTCTYRPNAVYRSAPDVKMYLLHEVFALSMMRHKSPENLEKYKLKLANRGIAEEQNMIVKDCSIELYDKEA